MELSAIKKIHLIGIAGVSMQGLAKVLEARELDVSGCDLALKGHDPKHITKDLDLVVISQAITERSPGYKEVTRAQELKVRLKSRAWVIGRLMQERAKIGVAIAGAHGKTTTTAMVGMILVEAGLDPTILNGGVIKQLKQSWRNGKGFHVVAEACEYDKQFLQFVPRAAILTNIDQEHLDTFPKGLPQIIRAFRDFVKLIPKNGVLIINGDDKHLVAVAKSARCMVKSVSLKKPWPGLKSRRATGGRDPDPKASGLKVPGVHNLLNATLAAKLAHELGVNHDVIKRALNKFDGVARRLEYLGEKHGVKVYDDYGHHPTELKTAFETLKEQFPDNRLVVVFQPHQATRTKRLFDRFVDALQIPDLVLLAPIYQVPGRDQILDVSSEQLAQQIERNAASFPSQQAALERLKKLVQPTDIVLTIGATKIDEVGKEFLRN